MSENDRILWHAKIKKYDQDLYKLICYPDKSKKQKQIADKKAKSKDKTAESSDKKSR